MGCYYAFGKRTNEVATHGINRFVYANEAVPRRARKRFKLLAAKKFVC